MELAFDSCSRSITRIINSRQLKPAYNINFVKRFLAN
jgi:hypothetical protein